MRTPDTNAQLVAENIAQQLEKRIGFRRAMKNSIGRAMRMGAKGIKVMLAGRLNGAEIARSECEEWLDSAPSVLGLAENDCKFFAKKGSDILPLPVFD